MKIKKFIVAIDEKNGQVTNTIDISSLAAAEREKLLSLVFTQAMNRLGYEKTKG